MSALEFSAFFSDYCEQKRIANCDVDLECDDPVIDGDEGRNGIEEDIENESKNAPIHVVLVKEVKLVLISFG